MDILTEKYLIIPWLTAPKDMAKNSSAMMSKSAWQKQANFLRKQISQAWSGPKAVEEVRNQRTKSY